MNTDPIDQDMNDPEYLEWVKEQTTYVDGSDEELALFQELGIDDCIDPAEGTLMPEEIEALRKEYRASNTQNHEIQRP